MFNIFSKQTNNKGFSLVEVLVALAVFAILSSGVFSVVTNSYRNFYGTGDKQVITEFAQEAVEAIRAIRDNSWQSIENVAGAGDQGVSKNASGYWEFSGSSDILGELTRVVVITDVQRDGSDNIVESGGTNDPHTKKITVTVSGDGIADYVLETYITNWSYSTWEQTDWSGSNDREFWSDTAMASSSYSNIATSTVGEISLSRSAAAGAIYSDLTNFTTTTQYGLSAWRPIWDYAESPDGNTLYVGGSTNVDIQAIDITHIRENNFSTSLWWNVMPDYVGAIAVHSSGKYLYAGNYYLSDSETSTMPFMWVIDTSDGSIVDSALCDDDLAGGTLRAMDIALNEDESVLYILSSYGGLHSYDVSTDGSSTTPKVLGGGGENSGVSNYWQEWGVSPQKMYLDESGATDYLYVVSDWSTQAMSKWDISDPTAPSLEYAYAGSGDCNDLEYLGDNGSGNEFAIMCDDSTTDLKIIRDTGSALSVIDTADPGTFTYGELEYDGDGEVLLLSKTAGNLAAWDVSDTSNLTEDLAEDSTTISSIYSTWPESYLYYSDNKGGYFFQDWVVGGASSGISWLPRPETRNTGVAYDYTRTIDIDSGSIVDGPHTNFPFLFKETLADLKHTDHGGKVTNSNGYDIMFTSDAAGTTILDYEIEKYASTTGEFIAWVEIPSLDSDTDIYMFYGNDNIDTTQERMLGVWSGNDYKYVNHMIPRHTLLDEQKDSSTFGNHLNLYGHASTTSSGKIGNDYAYDGNGDYAYNTYTTDFELVDEFSWSLWARVDGSSASSVGGLASITGSRFYTNNVDPGYFKLQIWDDTNTQHVHGPTNSVFDRGEWTKMDLVFDRPTTTLYINGSSLVEYSTDYDLLNDTTGSILTGTLQTNMYWLNGHLDEVRFANAAKSAGWIETAYNNENNPSSFYSVGSESLAGGYNTPGYIYSSIFDLGATGQELTSIAVSQNVPSGCSLQITAEASDDITFASSESQIYGDTAVSYFASSTPADFNGKRYFRYKVDMTACNGNADAPTLYDIKFNYK